MERDVTIRRMRETDPKAFADGERAQGWHADEAKFERRLKDMAEGLCVTLVADWRGEPAGYISVYRETKSGPFAGTGWPILVDFAVLEKFRRLGIGGMLMDEAERIAREQAGTVCLGVGLHSGYGSAQRMYVRRGYVPDGSGVWYRDAPCPPYAACTNDDELVLFLSKKLDG